MERLSRSIFGDPRSRIFLCRGTYCRIGNWEEMSRVGQKSATQCGAVPPVRASLRDAFCLLCGVKPSSLLPSAKHGAIQ